MKQRLSIVLWVCLALWGGIVWSGPTSAWATEPGERIKLLIPSTLDGSEQPSYLIVPSRQATAEAPAALLVSLHSWSFDYEQRNEELEALAAERHWYYLTPNFRGINKTPEACGSLLAQQDILDAVAHVAAHYPIDRRRIYLTGISGGGHMTMLMVGRYPDVWAAASSWVGISDLAAWESLHRQDTYGEQLRACCGGSPEDGPAVAEQYRQRSPLTHLAAAAEVPLDIAAGIRDGHEGSVPIRHSLEAFNVIARATDKQPITPDEIEQLCSAPTGRLANPQPSDTVADPSFGRAIYLRRMAGPARVSIFEGDHEGLATAAMAWLEQHQRPAAARLDNLGGRAKLPGPSR